MALNAAALQSEASSLATLAPYLSLHTANPGSSGTSESTAARQAASWSTTGGVCTATNIAFTGGASNGACTWVGLWSASTAGTFYGAWALSGDQTFNASGAYTVSSLTVTASST